MSAAITMFPTTQPKRVIIFGATGGTGRQLIAQALERGLAVTAFVRTPAKIEVVHPALTVVAGDVHDALAVRAAVAGHDAVLCAVGAGARSKARVREHAHRHIIEAMAAEGVDRLVTVSVLGVGDSAGNLTPFLKYLFFPLYLRRAAADHAEQERLVAESGLAWTVVRPPHLSNGPARGAFRHGFDAAAKGLALKVSRADLASFMLDQLDDPTYVGQSPGISY